MRISLVRISPSRTANKAKLACAARLAVARRGSAAMKDCSGNKPEWLRSLRIALGFGRAGAAVDPFLIHSCLAATGLAGLALVSLSISFLF